MVKKGSLVDLGVESTPSHKYSWKFEGESMPFTASQVVVGPQQDGLYELTEETACGKYTTVYKVKMVD